MSQDIAIVCRACKQVIRVLATKPSDDEAARICAEHRILACPVLAVPRPTQPPGAA